MKKNSVLEARFLKTKQVIKDFKKLGFNQNNFCIVPFTNIILEPNGSVGICRQLGTEFSIGNLKDNTLQEIWNGEIVVKWRREFLTSKPEICKNEIAYKNCNLCPDNNELLPLVEFSEKLPFSAIRKLTANFNGKCNLECQMCDVWEMPNGLYDEINFWSYAREEIFPNLKEIDMLSGEPFIQKDTYRLIDEVTTVNPDCLWTITTNAHWKLNDKIINYLDRIKFKNLIVSIDSLDPETYAKIRKKGNLETVLHNLDRLLEYQDSRIRRGLTPLNIHVNFLIQKDNWTEAQTFFNFCFEKKVYPFLTYCERPEEYSLSTLSEEEKVQVLNFYFDNFSKMDTYLSMRVLKPLVVSLEKKENKIYYLYKIKDINSEIDTEKD